MVEGGIYIKENIIVFGTTKEKAFNKLQELLDHMKQEDIKQIRKSKDTFSIITNNDDYYRAIGASDNARMYRWQYAYIDKDIDEETFESVVLNKFIYIIDSNKKIEDCYEWY